ncbi:MAG: hypothetical protein BYD32DRAFT_405854 [Podila humilis]|nr:MAG: hypothetical protein BYD32DRAFT_405854 [Podila humilis]
MTALDKLPSETLLEICPFLADSDIAQLSTTCQVLYRATYEHWSWHRKFVKRFGTGLLKRMVEELNDKALKNDANVDLSTTLPSALIRKWIDHHDQMILPARDMRIVHMGNQHWVMTAYPHSRFQEVAHLRSVWWLLVTGCFFGVPRGSYKVQWEILESASSAFQDTTFRAVVFDNHEFKETMSDPSGYLRERPSAAYLRPRDGKELFEYTSKRYDPEEAYPVPDSDHDDNGDVYWHWNPIWHRRTPVRRTFELPGTVTIDQDYQNVMVEIANIDW